MPLAARAIATISAQIRTIATNSAVRFSTKAIPVRPHLLLWVMIMRQADDSEESWKQRKY